jgi:hypothetical protein
MDVKQQQRAVIEFLLREGRPGEEITIRLHNVYGEAAYARPTVLRWINEIHRRNHELQADKAPG